MVSEKRCPGIIFAVSESIVPLRRYKNGGFRIQTWMIEVGFVAFMMLSTSSPELRAIIGIVTAIALVISREFAVFPLKEETRDGNGDKKVYICR